MTTVDVSFTRTGSADRLYLHNGLFGPATSALSALVGEFASGNLTGPWHSSEIRATVPGTVVRSVLAAVDEADPVFSEQERARFVAYRGGVEDGAQYEVYAIEC